MTDTRTAELAKALAALRDRVAAAEVAAGRAPGSVTLLPVTKFFPLADVRALASLGCHEFGESRDQEAAAKAAEFSARWHMLGSVQRNKAKSVARWADVVHSVDSVRLVTALAGAADRARTAGERTAPLEVYLQVSLDGDISRGGALAEELPTLANAVVTASSLALRGVMAIAPLGWEPERAFAELARVHESLLREFPSATGRSAGMSGDLETAIEYGSTCVRVGTALMGARPLTSP